MGCLSASGKRLSWGQSAPHPAHAPNPCSRRRPDLPQRVGIVAICQCGWAPPQPRLALVVSPREKSPLARWATGPPVPRKGLSCRWRVAIAIPLTSARHRHFDTPPHPPLLRRPGSPRAAARPAHPPSGAIGAFGPVRSLSGGFGRCPFGRLRSGRRAELGCNRRGLGTHRSSSLPPSAEIGRGSNELGTIRLAGPHRSGTRPRSGGLGSHPIRQVPLRAAPRGLGRAPLASRQGARAPAAFARGPSGSGRFGPHRKSVGRPRTRSSALGPARRRSARRPPRPQDPPVARPWGRRGGLGHPRPRAWSTATATRPPDSSPCPRDPGSSSSRRRQRRGRRSPRRRRRQ